MLIVLVLAIIAGLIGGWLPGLLVLTVGLAVGAAFLANLAPVAAPSTPPTPGATLPAGMTAATMTPATVASVAQLPGFQSTPAGTAPPVGSAAGSGPDTPAAAAFRVATSALFGYFQAQPVDPPAGPPLNLAGLQKTLMQRLDPATTVPNRMKSRICLPAQIPWNPADPLEPIMAAPVFPQPMYVPLKAYSEQYMLPGAEQVPPNSLGLLVTNRAFIEAYMVGLNHEMGRRLLWFGYPTDQRGSCFRQFWEVSGYVPQPGDPSNPAALAELLKDIPPINTWPTSTALGTHPNRPKTVENNVVLLLRGELLRRYPNAIIYAGKAIKSTSKSADPNGRILDTSDERYPIFSGTLKDDMTFLGFNLSIADAYGGTAASPEGYFFVFQQQPSEPRFGLEPLEATTPTAHWADLAWTNFGTNTDGGRHEYEIRTRSDGGQLEHRPRLLVCGDLSLFRGPNEGAPAEGVGNHQRRYPA